jgi:hypothetical protein
MITFPTPEGFEPPDGSAPGDSFEVLATVSLSEDGMTLTLDSVDGLAIGEDPELPTEEEMAPAGDAAGGDEQGFIEAMQRGTRA